MHIQISLTDGLPIYWQIVKQIRCAVSSGQLRDGDELPPIRVLAAHLGVTPNTVVRAYEELQRDGFVEKRQGAGTFVSNAAARVPKRERSRLITERIDQLLTEARHLGIPFEEVTEILQSRQERLEKFARTTDSGANHHEQ